MSKKFLFLYFMCFHSAVHGMDGTPKNDKSNKRLSLFECFDIQKSFSQQYLNASQDLQSLICSYACRDKQYWYMDKQIENVRLASFDPTGKYFAAGYKDNNVKIFNATVDKIEYELPVHSGELRVLKFDPTGRYLVTGCDDKTVRVFEAASGNLEILCGDSRQVSDIITRYYTTIKGLNFDPTGELLAVCCANEKIKILDIKSGDFVRTLPRHVDHISFDPTNKYAAVIVGKDISFIERETEKEIWKATSEYLFHSSIFDPTGKYLATVSHGDHTVEVCKVPSGSSLCVLHMGSNICSITFDPTGEYLAIGSDTGWGAVRIFQIPSERLIDATSHCDTVESACYDEDFIKKLKDVVPSGKLVHLISGNDKACSVSFDPTGKYLAVAYESLGARILTQYHQWTFQQKLLLRMLSTWLCIERPVSMQSFDELLHDVSSKFGCELKDLQDTLKTFPEKMVTSIWEKMKYMIKVYGKEMQQRRERMNEGNKHMSGRIAADDS